MIQENMFSIISPSKQKSFGSYDVAFTGLRRGFNTKINANEDKTSINYSYQPRRLLTSPWILSFKRSISSRMLVISFLDKNIIFASLGFLPRICLILTTSFMTFLMKVTLTLHNKITELFYKSLYTNTKLRSFLWACVSPPSCLMVSMMRFLLFLLLLV